MSWENRIQSKSKYYYQSTRVGGRVVKKYIGRACDPVVQVIAKGDQLGRAERSAAVDEVRSEQSEFKRLQPLLATLVKRFREGVDVCLLAEGFRRQNGEWQTMKTTDDTGAHSPDETTDNPPTRELFQHLVKLANRGDRDAADRLRRIIRSHRSVWDAVGDLTKHAEQSLIGLISGDNLVLGESLRMKIDDLRNSLRGEADDEAGRLLVDQIVVAWLEMQHTRMAAIQPQQHRRDARFWDDRYERANARFLAAIRELVTVRELLGDKAGVVQLQHAANG